MDPGTREFWRRHGPRTVLAASVIAALLALAMVLGSMGGRAQTDARVVRLTSAQWHDGGASAPSSSPFAPVADDQALAGPWRTAGLPLLLPAEPGAVTGSARRTLWFRVHVDAVAMARGPLHLYLPRWFAQGQLAVYADGGLIYRYDGSPGSALFFRPPVLVALGQTEGSAPPSTLLLRLDADATRPAALSSIYIGASARLVRMAAARDWVDRQLPFAGSVAFMLVGLFSLTVWLYRRRPQNLYIVAIAVLGMARLWHVSADPGPLPLADAWFAWLAPNALLWQVIALHFFLLLHHHRDQRRFNRVLPWAALALTVLTLPVVPAGLPGVGWLQQQAPLMVNAVVAAVGALSFWNAWRSRWLQGWVISVVYLFLVLCGAWDWVRVFVLHDVEGHDLAPYAGFVLFLTFTASMFVRYLTVLNEIEIVNAGLEQRLASREAELAESYERLRVVQQRQTLSEERSRLMQDMHDGLGSSLTGAIRAVANGGMTDAQVSQTLKDCMDDLKLAIDSMEPVEADLLLLLATLRFRLEPRIKSAGVALLWEVQEVPGLPWLDPTSALHILRIVQEAVANVLRHTRATQIRVSTASSDGGVQVRIDDNGQGFDVALALAQATGRGLRNQMRRAEALRGHATWQSGPTGTRFTLWLPLCSAL